MQLVQCNTQAIRVNGPVPRSAFQIRIAALHTTVGFFRCTGHRRKIIAERNIVYRSGSQQFGIARLHLHGSTHAPQLCRAQAGVVAAAHYIGIIVVRHHLEPLRQHIFGGAGAWVSGRILDHAAYLVFRVDRMTDLHGLCAGKKHIVTDQRLDSMMVLTFRKEHARLMIRFGLVHSLVDLVERHPVPHLAFVPAEHRFAVPGKEIDQRTIAPGTVVLHQIQRGLVM